MLQRSRCLRGGSSEYGAEAIPRSPRIRAVTYHGFYPPPCNSAGFGELGLPKRGTGSSASRVLRRGLSASAYDWRGRAECTNVTFDQYSAEEHEANRLVIA